MKKLSIHIDKCHWFSKHSFLGKTEEGPQYILGTVQGSTFTPGIVFPDKRKMLDFLVEFADGAEKVIALNEDYEFDKGLRKQIEDVLKGHKA